MEVSPALSLAVALGHGVMRCHHRDPCLQPGPPTTWVLGSGIWWGYAGDEGEQDGAWVQELFLHLDMGVGSMAGPMSATVQDEQVLWLFLPSVHARVNWKHISPT